MSREDIEKIITYLKGVSEQFTTVALPFKKDKNLSGNIRINS